MNAHLSSDLARLHDGDAEGIRPGRLWSLWDMLTFLANDFQSAIAELSSMRTSIFAGVAMRNGVDSIKTPADDLPEEAQVSPHFT
jgi:hypothetical protein